MAESKPLVDPYSLRGKNDVNKGKVPLARMQDHPDRGPTGRNQDGKDLRPELGYRK